MIYNYLKIAFRNLRKYKFISFINLFGLTIGLMCCLLIFTFILHELSYDKFQPDANRVYRVARIFNDPRSGAISLTLSSVAPPFGPLLKNDFKEIEDMTRMRQDGPIAVQYDDKIISEENAYVADEHFFDFFKIKMVKGNPEKAFTDPYSVMMTEETAKNISAMMNR